MRESPRRTRCSRALALFAVALAGLATGAADTSPTPKPGEVTDVPFAPLGKSLRIWLPSDHAESEDRKWPVWLYYHGTDGGPTVRFPLSVVDRDDWIVIGMTYREAGRFRFKPESLRAERALYHELLRDWNARYSLRIDPGRVFVGGFSKGGWVSALFFESDPALAGAVILGAGAFEGESLGPSASSDAPANPQAVYVGIGESDGNLAMSHRARNRFREAGADVTLDVWENCRHTLPASPPEFLRQWLCLRAAGSDRYELRAEAVEWFEARLDAVDELESPSAKFFELQRLSDSPFHALIDRELVSELAEMSASLAWIPEVVREREAQKRFREILSVEMLDRYVATLREAHEDYTRAASEFEGTRYGKKAALSRDRTALLLP